MADGVEFYVTECENVDAPFSTQFGDLTEPFRACTVLVSFAKSDAERAALWPLHHALAFGHTSSSVCDGAEWLQKLPKQLLERLKLTGHDMVVAAIYAGSSGDSDAEAVQAAVDSLQQCFRASLSSLLVVADTSSHQLSRVTGVSGFVVGASGTNAGTARSVFLCLAMFSAPETLTDIDLFFLDPVFGTAESPTVLVEAIWLCAARSTPGASARRAEGRRRGVASPEMDPGTAAQPSVLPPGRAQPCHRRAARRSQSKSLQEAARLPAQRLRTT